MKFTILIIAMMFSAQSAWAAECVMVTTVAQLTEKSVAVERAFADFDKVGLLKHASLAVSEILPCLGEAVTPAAAASFHRTMAFQDFFNRNHPRALRELRAARRLEPTYHFPSDVVGEGHPFLTLYEEAATLSDGELQPVYPPKGGYIMVDGVRDAPRPSDTPVIIQVFAPSKTLMETRYLLPGDTLPQWSENPFGISQAPARVDFKKPRIWYVAGSTGVVAGGVMYALAMNQHSQFNDTSSPDGAGSYARLTGNMSKANSYGWTSVALGSAGVALSSVGLVFHFKRGEKEVATDVD
jgi:hypothetical protein